MRIRIKRAVSLNLNGFDGEPTPLEVGEHDIGPEPAPHVAGWLTANPSYGEVIEGAPEPEEPEAAAAVELDGDDQGDGIEALTVGELRARASELGLAVSSRAAKAELIQALRAPAEDAEDDDEAGDE